MFGSGKEKGLIRIRDKTSQIRNTAEHGQKFYINHTLPKITFDMNMGRYTVIIAKILCPAEYPVSGLTEYPARHPVSHYRIRF
jgi:hypothetical protein